MFYTLTKYKKNGIEDVFISCSQVEMTKEEFYDGIVAYVDQIAPVESRMESGLDTLVITFITEKESQDFIKGYQIKGIRGSLKDGTITYDSNMYRQKMEKLCIM